MTISNVVFISAFTNNIEDYTMHSSMKHILNMNNLNFQVVNGVYKGQSELSFMVELTDKCNLDFFKTMGRLFQQESILYVNDDSDAYLVFTEDEASDKIGKMQIVSKEEAESNDAYTHVTSTDTYLMAK